MNPLRMSQHPRSQDVVRQLRRANAPTERCSRHDKRISGEDSAGRESEAHRILAHVAKYGRLHQDTRDGIGQQRSDDSRLQHGGERIGAWEMTGTVVRSVEPRVGLEELAFVVAPDVFRDEGNGIWIQMLPEKAALLLRIKIVERVGDAKAPGGGVERCPRWWFIATREDR